MNRKRKIITAAAITTLAAAGVWTAVITAASPAAGDRDAEYMDYCIPHTISAYANLNDPVSLEYATFLCEGNSDPDGTLKETM